MGARGWWATAVRGRFMLPLPCLMVRFLAARKSSAMPGRSSRSEPGKFYRAAKISDGRAASLRMPLEQRSRLWVRLGNANIKIRALRLACACSQLDHHLFSLYSAFDCSVYWACMRDHVFLLRRREEAHVRATDARLVMLKHQLLEWQ